MKFLHDQILKIPALSNLPHAHLQQFAADLEQVLKTQNDNQKTCLNFFVDKLCNDLSTFVMNAQRIKLKAGEMQTNPGEYQEFLNKVLTEIRYKGRLANERLKGVGFAILDQQSSFLEFDLLAIIKNMQELFEQEPTKIPIKFTINTDQQELIVLGNKEQLTLVFHLLLFALKGFANPKNCPQLNVNCSINVPPNGRTILFELAIPIPFNPRMKELNETQIALLIIKQNHQGSLEFITEPPGIAGPAGGFALKMVLPILAK